MMKKLVVAAVLCCAAVAAQAVSFTAYNLGGDYDGYKITSPFAFDMGGTDNKDEGALSMLEMFFTGTDAKSVTESTTWSQHYLALNAEMNKEGMIGSVVDGSGTFSISESSSAKKYSVVFLLLKDGIAPGSAYTLFETVTYDGVATANPTFDMAGAKTLATGFLNTDAVPEPTSGLLLLLGVAGLALKRKQK